MERKWYLVIDGEADGPYDERDLDVKFRTGELTSSLLAWCEGMTEWKPIY